MYKMLKTIIYVLFMYTNIPIIELTNIIYESLTYNYIPDDHKNEIMTQVKQIIVFSILYIIYLKMSYV
jgi:hypothetical protein